MYAWIGKKRRGAQITEDELTSCVFGPLRVMHPSQAWKSCLALLGLDDWSPCPEPSRVDIRFWPRFKRDDGGMSNQTSTSSLGRVVRWLRQSSSR